MTVLIDSWAWIEYFKGSKAGKAVEEFLQKDYEIITSPINVSEVFGYFLRHKNKEAANEALSFMLKSAFVIPIETRIAVEAALAKYEKGFGLADAIVYVTAKSRQATVLTGDPDFKNEEGVHFLA